MFWGVRLAKLTENGRQPSQIELLELMRKFDRHPVLWAENAVSQYRQKE
jgi:hypothetical protein